MKTNELMVGDFVMMGKKTYRCANICGHTNDVLLDNGVVTNVGNLIPIPLTPEILEKNGFEIYEQDFTSNSVYKFGSLDYMEYEEYHKYFNIGCKITYKHFVTETTYIHGLMRIRYVHELQHALKLCGIEKTIEL